MISIYMVNIQLTLVLWNKSTSLTHIFLKPYIRPSSQGKIPSQIFSISFRVIEVLFAIFSITTLTTKLFITSVRSEFRIAFFTGDALINYFSIGHLNP